MRVSGLPLLALLLVLGVVGLSCLDLSWKEGIGCSAQSTCPDDLTCCRGTCQHQCPGLSADGGVCPIQMGGCFGCVPGCACTCGGLQLSCCMQLGVGTCTGCP
jgi:hypothetical protein